MKVIEKKKLVLFFEILEILGSIPATVRVEDSYYEVQNSDRFVNVTITINQNSSSGTAKKLNK